MLNRSKNGIVIYMATFTGKGTPPAPVIGLHVPLYVYPSAGTGLNIWQSYADLKKKYNIEMFVVMNPDNGDFGGDYVNPDLNFIAGKGIMDTAGVTVLGYVYTLFGLRDANTVKARIDTYYTIYSGVGGIMFDEMTNNSGFEAYYQDLSDYVHTKGVGQLAVGNPGTSVQSSFTPTMDMIKIYEGSGYPLISTITSRTAHASRDKWGLTCHALTEFNSKFVISCADKVKYMFLTNKSGSNPYNIFSAYADPLASTLGTVNNNNG